MRITIESDSAATREMSVVDPNLKQENEVNTMTTSTAVASSSTTASARESATEAVVESVVQAAVSARPVRSSAHYTASERFVAGLGLALLRWSNRRADLAQPTHARMALLLENERVRAGHAPFATASGR
jgi:hypothetical protein